ncbi:aldehyde ferredoxin oxidoreductase family protein, partial [Candidatus Aminicenantes bacterium AH-873-B07]|nr:aldehyde ferredoxin oxidoreductase family protein [Candidatus Aminicenantes bacterium AH-873-B07]
ETYTEEFAKKWVGGRGFAIKILWDELKPEIDPLGPENKLIVAVGPIAGIPAPNTGKTVVAAKSPLTGGYGDGNLGTRVTDHLRKAGYDILIIEGKAEKPIYIYIEDDKVEFLPANEIWGKGSYETLEWLYGKYGRAVGILTIGQAGENKVLYSIIRSMEGRAGGRPGMGAVMGSKNLKAIVVKGTKKIPIAEPEEMRKIGLEDLKKVGEIDKKTGWSIQGTTGVLAWCNEVAALPVRNMRKTFHKEAWRIDGERLSAARIATYGCPNCTMRCGITILDKEGNKAEMDYENIGMLGSNLEIFDLAQVGSLNHMCDDFGLDTISSGGVLAFYADAIDQGAIDGDFKFGDAEKAKELLKKIAYREDIGDFLAQGTMRMAQKIGKGSEAYAMHVKGLEISAYNCKFAPGMALAFATSSIGAHHKEAWVITFEINETERGSYGKEKAEKIVELQRIRGGLFEYIVACRFPWIELGWGIEHYPVYFNKVTGLNWSLDDFWKVADRIYALIRAFWVREFPNWNRKKDYPPKIWFDPSNADKEGIIAGKILEYDKYDKLLDYYYEFRDWDKRGIPKRKTMEDLGLAEEAKELEKYIKLEN